MKTETGLLEAVCTGCGNGIVDRYVMRVEERSYHEGCLSCAACHAPLSKKCFTRDLKLYCKTDYERIFGVKCARCMEMISCSDFVMRVANLVFHLDCFACVMCGENLPRGAHFILRQGQPICMRDFEHELHLNSSHGKFFFVKPNCYNHSKDLLYFSIGICCGKKFLKLQFYLNLL